MQRPLQGSMTVKVLCVLLIPDFQYSKFTAVLDILHQHGILSEPANHSGVNINKRGGRKPESLLGLRLTPPDQQYHRSYLTSSIAKCTEDVTVVKTFTARGNHEAWMTTEMRLLLTAQDAAFRAGDMTDLCSARSVLPKGIKAASGTYAEKIQRHLCDTGNTKQMWQGVQALTDYKSRQGVNDDDASLPDRLKIFFAHFEAPNPTTRGVTRVNPQKAGCPDNILKHVRRTCAGELADVLPHILNISLSQAIVPRCFKTSTIIPVAKKSAVSCLNDYHLSH